MLGSLKRFWVPFLVLPWGVECSAESQVSSQSEVRVRSDRSGESDKDHSQANFISGVPGRVCIAERWVGNCRPDLLDHMAALNERHLKRLLSEYEDAELTARDRGSAPTSAPRTCRRRQQGWDPLERDRKRRGGSKPAVQRDRSADCIGQREFRCSDAGGCSDRSAHPA